MMSYWSNPTEIDGRFVSVVPLSMAHHDDLVEMVPADELHHLWHIPPTTEIQHSVSAEIARRLKLYQAGSVLPFAVIEKQARTPIGMTSYLNFDAESRKTEIDIMCSQPSVRDSIYNTECQFLLIKHAFEKLNYISVEFKIHFNDKQRRHMIEQLGARLECVLLSNTSPTNSFDQNTAIYSMSAFDWPSIKAKILSLFMQNPNQIKAEKA